MSNAPVSIFTFKSGSRELFAFAADKTGAALPARHGPWKLVEEINPRQKSLPYALDIDAVQEALVENGYQMWRPKKGA